MTEALNKDEIARNEAAEVLRGLVSTIRLTPDGESKHHIELVGKLGAIMLLAEQDNKKPAAFATGLFGSVRLVAGA